MEMTQVLLTERGTTFGYQDLVVDFRSIPSNAIFWCKSSVGLYPFITTTQPGYRSVTGGKPALIETIATSGNCSREWTDLFIETHPQPAEAQSDGANMLSIRSTWKGYWRN